MISIVAGESYTFTTTQGVQLSKADRKAGKPAYYSEVREVVARECIPLLAGNLELWRVEDSKGELHNVWASQLTKVGDANV